MITLISHNLLISLAFDLKNPWDPTLLSLLFPEIVHCNFVEVYFSTRADHMNVYFTIDVLVGIAMIIMSAMNSQTQFN